VVPCYNEEGNVAKVIVNARNFGHLRSPVHGMLQASGDAVVLLFSDLQDPPELVGDFVREWLGRWCWNASVSTLSDRGTGRAVLGDSE
jgi:hypothetical protein